MSLLIEGHMPGLKSSHKKKFFEVVLDQASNKPVNEEEMQTMEKYVK